MTGAVCKVAGCGRAARYKKLCQRHIHHMRTHGRILRRTQNDPNEIVLRDGYAEIVLYDRKQRETGRALVDVEDLPCIVGFKWCIQKGSGYVVSQRRQKRVFLHRIILNAPVGLDCDHKKLGKKAKLDNRKSNLRLATRQQNAAHRPKMSGNKSGFKGVTKKRNGWCAYIEVGNVGRYIGTFMTKEDAALAYDSAAKKLHGEFAYQNFGAEV